MAAFNNFTLFILLSLILFASTSLTARKPFTTTTTTSSLTPTKLDTTITQSLASTASKLQEEGILGVKKEEEDGDCSGLKMEECLRRRSIVAHTDYIYTQDVNNGP